MLAVGVIEHCFGGEGSSLTIAMLTNGGYCRFAGKLDRGLNCLKQFEGGSAVTCVRIADGCLFAACHDCIIHCWDMATGRPVNVFFGHKRMVSSIDLVGGLEQEGRLYSGSSDCTIKVAIRSLFAQCWLTVAALGVGSGPYQRPVYLTICSLLAHCWGVITGSFCCLRTFDCGGVVTAVQVLGDYVFAGCWDRKLLKFNLETAEIEQVTTPIPSRT